MSLAARVLAGLLALLLAAAAGWRQGVRATLADWRAADLAAERAGADLRGEQQRMAATAAARYEAQRATRERQHADTTARLRHALSGPIQACQAVVLGDVLVPADVVASLRDAGADPAGDPTPATGGAGR
jgi:hypothetical protein